MARRASTASGEGREGNVRSGPSRVFRPRRVSCGPAEPSFQPSTPSPHFTPSALPERQENRREATIIMPPTPSRGSARPDRGRQGSSVHQTPAAATAAAPYPQRRNAPGTPFVHPALVAASGPSGSTSVAAASRGRKPFNHRNLFAKDLRNLMYAFGDVPNPDPESVALLEEMTVDFITDLCCRARPSPYSLGLGTSNISNSSSAFGATLDDQDSSAATGAGAETLPPRAPHRLRVKLEDFRHALRKDVEAKKLGRMEQLLYADKVVTEARRVGGVEEVAEKAGALNTDAAPPASQGDRDTKASDNLDTHSSRGRSNRGRGGGARSSRGGGGRGGRGGKARAGKAGSTAPSTPAP